MQQLFARLLRRSAECFSILPGDREVAIHEWEEKAINIALTWKDIFTWANVEKESVFLHIRPRFQPHSWTLCYSGHFIHLYCAQNLYSWEKSIHFLSVDRRTPPPQCILTVYSG